MALLSLSHSNAQTIDYVTGNLINFSGSPTSTTSNWNNGVYVNQLGCFGGNTPGNCGPYPSVRTDGNINFSYGQVNLNQVINVANAVAGATGPVTVTGFNFNFRAKNGNGWDDGRVDQLNAYVQLYGPTHNLLENYNYNLNNKFDWSNFAYSATFTTPHPLSTVGTAQVGFIGKDNNYWAGPYGPEIQNVSFSLKYSVNPCVTNPGYSPSCPGFNNVITSSNLVPNPGAQASWGNGINNSFAIQTALQNSGSGLIVHGFDYGYRVNATQSYCEAEFIICWSWHSGGSVQVNAGITNAKGQNIYSVSRNYNESGYSNENFHYRFPTSMNQMMLGNFNFTAYTGGDAWVGNMYSRMVYSQDPCVSNPNYLPTCTNKVAVTYTAPKITSSSDSKDAASTGTTIVNVGGAQISSTGVISAPDNIPQTIKDTQASIQQSQTTATIGQPASSKTPSLSSIMNIISQVQANDKAVQSMAVQNANKVIAASSAQSQEQAMATVSTLNAMSIASSQISQDIAPVQMQPISSQSASSAVQLQVQPATSLQNLLSTAKVSNEQTTSQTSSTYQQPQNNTNTSAIESSQTQLYRSPTNITLSTPQTQILEYQEVVNTNSEFALTPPNTKVYLGQMLESQQSLALTLPVFTDTKESGLSISKLDNNYNELDNSTIAISSAVKGNTLMEMIDLKPIIDMEKNEQQSDTVKKNVQSNELAGGVDIAAMAIQPKGFEIYSVTLKDGMFYEPKEIYGNQKTIDNIRLLRSLSSDRLHQEMVDQQYRR